MKQQKPSFLRRIVYRIKSGIVQETPPELAACEFCGKLECSQDEWIKCRRRIIEAACLEELVTKEKIETIPCPAEPPATQANPQP